MRIAKYGFVAALALTAASCSEDESSTRDEDNSETTDETTETSTTQGQNPDLASDRNYELDCLDKEVDLEQDGEQWRYCESEGFDLVSIQFSNEAESQETFVLKDDSLVYASEQDNTGWSVNYEVENNEVVSHNSIGLGETELDDWEPESILEQWEQRKETFESLKS